MKYKYNCRLDTIVRTAELNELGNEGWKLVSVISNGHNRDYYFVKEIEEPEEFLGPF